MKGQTIAYPIGNNLYLNVTNRCSNNCVFCIRNTEEGVGFNLWLQQEPSFSDLQAALAGAQHYREVVFCGYGEPLQRLELVKKTAAFLKQKGARIRINTNGQANLVYGRDITPELKGLADVISISLNAGNAAQYVALCRPAMGPAAYGGMLDFTARCRDIIPQVVLTVVEWPGVEIEKCREIASRLGVSFRVRPFSGTLKKQQAKP
ncbi:TatD family nuclease-associated radical SAM protein [Desulfotomaculum copahuensis]|uniref:Radical SAM protein n=1 Tax=Desulfotomaculum copahuensis TaxID=1838280 RepID=A0A1B7LEB7_9FIRM|nr:TatD family nuclease-associated radical SAM protein [Desulfotomaculum copahuensis]OAT81448.1 radical SAM protein [Desulfotomaculum copahuensis]